MSSRSRHRRGAVACTAALLALALACGGDSPLAPEEPDPEAVILRELVLGGVLPADGLVPSGHRSVVWPCVFQEIERRQSRLRGMTFRQLIAEARDIARICARDA